MTQIINKKLFIGFLGLVLTAVLSTGAYAQSGSKGHGSSSKKNNTSAAKRKMEREQAKLVNKMTSQIAKDDFAAIKLTLEQRKTLKGLVSENFEELSKFDMKISQMIPAKNQKALKKSYLMAKKEGKMNAEAMEASMMKIGLSKVVQTRVMTLNKSKETLMDEIRKGVTEVLNDEQKVAIAKAKEAMMAKEKKEEMKDSADASSESQG